jgi:hypothetical protein
MHERMRGVKTDHRELDHEVREQDLLCALPLLRWARYLGCLKLVTTEVRDSIDYHPGNATAKVDDLQNINPRILGGNLARTSCMRKLIKPVARIGLPI